MVFHIIGIMSHTFFKARISFRFLSGQQIPYTRQIAVRSPGIRFFLRIQIPHGPASSRIVRAFLCGFQVIPALFCKVGLQAVDFLPLRQHAVGQEGQDIIKFSVDALHCGSIHGFPTILDHAPSIMHLLKIFSLADMARQA